jgi:ketosteroid isomerase-like protein
MSHENKGVLLRANEAVVRGDHEGFLSYCTEDVVWEFVGERTLEGKEAVRRYMGETYVEPPRFTVLQLIAEGEFVTAVGEIALKGEGGREVEYDYCDVWRLRGGRLAGLRAFVVERKGGG